MAEQGGRALLEAVDARVLAALLVPDLGFGDRPAHAVGGQGGGVGAKIDHAADATRRAKAVQCRALELCGELLGQATGGEPDRSLLFEAALDEKRQRRILDEHERHVEHGVVDEPDLRLLDCVLLGGSGGCAQLGDSLVQPALDPGDGRERGEHEALTVAGAVPVQAEPDVLAGVVRDDEARVDAPERESEQHAALGREAGEHETQRLA